MKPPQSLNDLAARIEELERARLKHATFIVQLSELIERILDHFGVNADDVGEVLRNAKDLPPRE